MFLLRGHIVCFLTVFATAQGMTVRRPGQGSVLTSRNASTFRRKTSPDADLDYESVEEWGDVFPAANSPWNDTVLLPTSVYNFRTGEFFNWDLNGSAANHFPKSEQFARNSIPVTGVDLTSNEDRPRRYSSKYAKDEEGSIEENFEILKEPKADESTEESVREDKEGLQREENEQYEVYEQHKKPLVLDNEKAESGHESHKPTNEKHKEGSGEEHHEDHHNKKKTKGLKDYKGEHHYHKGEKGHHDKEGHKGQYSDKKGSTKTHKEGAGHFESGVHGEKGQKESKHSDKEEYKKGHSTRGGHVVHKKDEYEKKHEFYDEHHEGGDSEKHGEYFQEHQAKSGGHKKGGHKQGEEGGEHKAKKGHYEKGNKFHEHKGHKKAGGHEKKHGHDEKYGKKQGHSDWKKFAYESGKGKGGGDSGGAHSNVGHLLVAPPLPASAQTFTQRQLPEFADQSGKESKSVQTKKKSEEQEEVQEAVSSAELARPVFEESAPIPSTELKPPPLLTPKLLIIIKPLEGDSVPVSLEGVLRMAGKEMSFQQVLDTNRASDPFPDEESPDMKHHRIVKKQMADYPSTGKNKRSIVAVDPEVFIGVVKDEDKEDEKLLNTLREPDFPIDQPFKLIRAHYPTRRNRFGEYSVRFEPEGRRNYIVVKRKQSKERTEGGKVTTNVNGNHNISLRDEILRNLVGRPCKKYVRYADKGDYHSYFECEVEADGGMKFQHKRCPEGEIFSPKYLECLRLTYLRAIHRHKRFPLGFPRKIEPPEPNSGPENVEPANEWIDSPQNGVLKIPSEFKPKQKPKLKIYHLKWENRIKTTLPVREDRSQRSIVGGFGAYESRRRLSPSTKGNGKKQSFRHHSPRSFLVRVNKKEGKENQDHELKNREEVDEDEDYDDEDYEDYEEDEDDEREEAEEENRAEWSLKKLNDAEWNRRRQSEGEWNRRRQNEAEWNRGRQNEDFKEIATSLSPKRLQSKNDELFSLTSQPEKHLSNSKKVLIDANIKVDGTLGSAIRKMLRKNEKGMNYKKSREKERRRAKAVTNSNQDFGSLIKRSPRPKNYFDLD